MSGIFPQSLPDWCNINLIRRNTLPPRSYFSLFANEKDALASTSDKSCSINLSGTWKFHHAVNPFEAPQDFALPNFDASKWSDIQVPGIWQLQGFGHPHYTNVPYPFFVDPPNVSYTDNQTGSYIRKFTLPASLTDQQLRLRFEGVDSAFHVYVNGVEVGYSQGSRNPSEFDITALVNKSEENILAVRVYQYCDGSYLEDQDQWRFSGIFRDVWLHAFPKIHIKDFQAQTILDEDYTNADLKVTVDVEGADELSLKLLDQSGSIVAKDDVQVDSSRVELSLTVQEPLKWTAETPHLYKLLLSYGGRVIVQNVGFRKIEIKNGIYLVNGKRIVFRGANRHEHHPVYGRAVPYEFMKQDLVLMKQSNINALRTCHQPSDPRLYALADELGLWVMDEADLECHGFWTIDDAALPPEVKAMSFTEKKSVLLQPARYTSDNPEWKEQYVDRAIQLCMRDKNHPCVVMWSLGNEAFYGRNFQNMYDEIKAIDPTRPIHYEGDPEAKTVDLFSQMYPAVDDIIKFGQESNFTKPLVLCEFVHAMGNGPGGIKEYIDAFYTYPRLQGGWVWEWANHGLKTKDSKTGEEFYAYGGDFGDEPNDYNFIMDGVLFSDHTPTPGLMEYRKAIEPVQIQGYDNGKLTIFNRHDTTSLDHLKCEAWLVSDGQKNTLGDIQIPTGVQPHSSAELDLPLDFSTVSGEIYLQVDFQLRQSTAWASSGHVVASSQIQVRAPEKPSLKSVSAPAPTIVATTASLKINTPSSTFTFSLASGKLTSWRKRDSELIHSSLGPELTFYRALTDNDRPQDGQDWTKALVNLIKQHVRKVTWSNSPSDSTVTVVVTSKYAPPVFSWSIDTSTTYRFHGDGTWHVHCSGTQTGLNLPPTLPRIGLEFAIPQSFDHVSWFGRGPGESYRDKKLSQHVGNYSATVDELFVDYEFPQESSNRTDVRWVKFASTSSLSSTVESAVDSLTRKVEEIVSSATLDLPNLAVSTATHTDPPVASHPTPSLDSAQQPHFTASFGAQEGFSFTALHYTAHDLDKATHPHELHKMKRDYVVVRLDAQHHGLGTGSCGPKTMEKYALKTGDFEFDVWFD